MGFHDFFHVFFFFFFVFFFCFTAIAECACFGDPHCKSYDDKFLHYQGTCQYVMTTDDCVSNPAPPTFEVLVVFYSRNHNALLHGRASWVKELTVSVHGYVSVLMHINKVLVPVTVTSLRH